MNIQIHTDLPFFAALLAEEISQNLNQKVAMIRQPCRQTRLRYGSDVSSEVVSYLFKSLLPITFKKYGEDTALAPDQIVIELGDTTSLADWHISLVADSRPLLKSLAEEFGDGLGFMVNESEFLLVESNEISCLNPSSFARQVVSWFMRRRGIEITQSKKEGVAPNQIRLQIHDPEAARRPARERMDVVIGTDEPDAVESLRKQLLAAGYPSVQVVLLDDSREEIDRHPLGIGSAWFKNGHAPEEAIELRRLITSFLRDQGIDQERYPFKFINNEDVSDDSPLIMAFLPLAACRSMRKRPYGDNCLERFEITIQTDNPRKCEPCRKILEEAGFVGIEIDDSLDEDDCLKGFRLQCHRSEMADDIYSLLHSGVERFMTELGADSAFKLHLDDFAVSKAYQEVNLSIPCEGVSDGSLLARINSPKAFDCTVICEDEEVWQDVIAEVREMGFKDFNIRSRSVDAPEIHFGGAPDPLLDRLVEVVGQIEPLSFKRKKAWSSSDDDIFLFLPTREKKEVSLGLPETPLPFSPAVVFGRRELPATRDTFLQRQDAELRVGSVSLPCRQGGVDGPVPAQTDFSHFCLDANTAATLEHLAWSVHLGEPCLLEGETSTSKTSSILFLAAALDRPVLRLNLNGQTDTGELIGRYMPEAGGSNWCWHDGLVLQAMRKGFWLILDELNLAEPQVVERLNPVLEQGGSLTLTEHDGSVIGDRENPVHPDFRIFATMNPASYTGRMMLSPAYRDRWQGYRLVPPPGEQEYAQMLNFLVTGVQPEVLVGDCRYQSRKQRPRFPDLAHLAVHGGLLAALARFHALLENASRKNDAQTATLGGGHREDYLFTRRGILQMLAYVQAICRDGRLPLVRGLELGLSRYYFAKLRNNEDLVAAHKILQVAGLEIELAKVEGNE